MFSLKHVFMFQDPTYIKRQSFNQYSQ